MRVTYSATVTDNTSDGRRDSLFIIRCNSYTAGGTLTPGDIEILLKKLRIVSLIPYLTGAPANPIQSANKENRGLVCV